MQCQKKLQLRTPLLRRKVYALSRETAGSVHPSESLGFHVRTFVEISAFLTLHLAGKGTHIRLATKITYI